MILKFLLKRWRVLGTVALVAVIAVQYELAHRSKRASEKEFEATMAALKLAKAVASTQAQVIANMTEKEKATAKQVTAAGGKITSRTTADVTIKDSVKAPAVYAPTASPEVRQAEINWTDPYGRFHLNLPSGLFTRSQRFTFSSTLYVGPDGTTRFADTEFREFSPTTGEEIPVTGTSIRVALQTVIERPAGPGPWHVRLAGVWVPGSGGLAAQVNPWRGLILTGGAIYGKAHGIEGVAGLGWRLRLPFFDSTLGISGFAAYGSKGLRGAPGGTAELTR